MKYITKLIDFIKHSILRRPYKANTLVWVDLKTNKIIGK